MRVHDDAGSDHGGVGRRRVSLFLGIHPINVAVVHLDRCGWHCPPQRDQPFRATRSAPALVAGDGAVVAPICRRTWAAIDRDNDRRRVDTLRHGVGIERSDEIVFCVASAITLGFVRSGAVVGSEDCCRQMRGLAAVHGFIGCGALNHVAAGRAHSGLRTFSLQYRQCLSLPICGGGGGLAAICGIRDFGLGRWCHRLRTIDRGRHDALGRVGTAIGRRRRFGLERSLLPLLRLICRRRHRPAGAVRSRAIFLLCDQRAARRSCHRCCPVIRPRPRIERFLRFQFVGSHDSLACSGRAFPVAAERHMQRGHIPLDSDANIALSADTVYSGDLLRRYAHGRMRRLFTPRLGV